MELPPETRYVDRDGKALAFQAFGQGPPHFVIALEAAAHLDLIWTDPGYFAIFERAAALGRMVTFERLGFGLSDPLDHVRPVEDQADDLIAVMDAASIDRAVVWGINTTAPGVVVAAARHPDRFAGLLLAVPMIQGWRSAPVDELAGWTPEAIAAWEEVVEQGMDRWGSGVTLGLFAPGLASRRSARQWGLLERASASPATFRALWEASSRVDVTEVLGLVRCPTIVARHADNPYPAASHRMVAERIPGARFVELPAATPDQPFDEFWRPYQELALELAGLGTSASDGRRRLATVAFTDIVGSTELAARLGDAEWRALLERHDALSQTLVAEGGGRVVKGLGDGVMSVFDGPAHAIRSTERLLEQVRPLGIQLRAGIHTGECEIRGADLAGMAVHIAARVAAAAGPGELLVSRTVRDLVVGSGISFASRGTHRLKGVDDAWELFAVTAQDSAPIAIPDQRSPLRTGDRMILAGARRAPNALRRMNALIQRRSAG